MINFPQNPTIGQVFNGGSRTWTWDGTAWVPSPIMTGATGPTGPIGPTGPQGVTGPIGAGIAYKGVITDPSQLPSSGNTNGDAYINSTNGDLWVYSSATSAWVNNGAIVDDGPTGPAGPTGPTGAAGAASTVAGPTGPTGANGTNGPTGPTGAAGAASTVAGPTGPAGANGPTGPTGEASTVAGPTGPAGANGPTGPTGAASTVAGPTGPTGAVSTTPGPTGSAGPTGPTGAPQTTLPLGTSTTTLLSTDVGDLVIRTASIAVETTSAFAVGGTVTIYNNSASPINITQGTSVTLRLAGTGLTGTRTLAQYGLATLVCTASNTYVVSGSGVG
jgi:hypothetical protein